MENRFSFFRGLLVFVFIVLACFFILHVPQITGLSDNGDFGRVITPNSIISTDSSTATFFFQNEYIMDISEDSFFYIIGELFQENFYQDYDYTSTQFLFVKISKVLNYISNVIFDQPIEKYNISFLSILYILVFAFAFVLLYKSFRTDSKFKNILIFITFAIIFLDLGYLIYFNSFYGEALQYCSFMLMIAILAYTIQSFRRQERPTSFIYILLTIFFVCVYIFSASKVANLPIGIVFGISGIIVCILATQKLVKCFLIAIGVCCLFFSCYHITKTPQWMNDVTNYHSVFYGILKNSDNIYEDLDFFDIDRRYSYLANTTAYINEYQQDIYTPQFQENVYQNISKGKILGYYLLHPGRMFEKIEISLENAKFIKPVYLANYTDNGENNKLEQNNHFSIWSNLRQALNITSPTFFLLLLIGIIGYIIASIVIYIKNNKRNQILGSIMLYESNLPSVLLYITLLLSLILALVIPFMGNGEADLQKHMFLFNNIYDVLIAIIIVGAITNFSKLIDILKKNSLFRVTTSLFIVLIVAIVGVSNSINSFASTKVKETSFGAYNNKEIVWQIIDQTDTTLLLISKEPIFKMPFDVNNNNYWVESSLRHFLNTDFYNCFSEDEKARILKTSSKILLCEDKIAFKTRGSIPYYLSPFPESQDTNIQNFYQTTCQDYVFLLNVFDYKKYIIDTGIKTKENMAFLTPYTNNTNMIKYIGNSGYIFINDAKLDYSIYPCITISKL